MSSALLTREKSTDCIKSVLAVQLLSRATGCCQSEQVAINRSRAWMDLPGLVVDI